MEFFHQNLGQVITIQYTRDSCYFIQHLSKRNILELKYMAQDIYNFLQSLLPYDLFDECDNRYFNHSHLQLLTLYIYLQTSLCIIINSFLLALKLNCDHQTLKLLSHDIKLKKNSLLELNSDSNTTKQQIIIDKFSHSVPNHLLFKLFPIKTSETLFFIQYIPYNLVRIRWY